MNSSQLLKKDEEYLLQLASEYFESAIENILEAQGLLKAGSAVFPDFSNPNTRFNHMIPFYNTGMETMVFIRDLESLRKAEMICNLPVVNPINATRMLCRIAATYMVVDFERYQADVERICFSNPKLHPGAQAVLLYRLVSCYTDIENFEGSYNILKLLDEPKYRQFGLDPTGQYRKSLEEDVLHSINVKFFESNKAAYFKTLDQAYRHYQQYKKVQLLQKARLVYNTSDLLKDYTSRRQGVQRQALLGGGGGGGGGQRRQQGQGRATITDYDMKQLGVGAGIMRDRVQSGKQLPRIQYKPKSSTQTQRQQRQRQTVKYVTSDMKDDVYKQLLDLMKSKPRL